MEAINLYQFELCPFCHKVKAALDVKGLPYRKIEVNPYSKAELPPLPEGTPKKVPVLEFEGRVIQDSTAILAFLEERFHDQNPLLPVDEAGKRKAAEIEAWVDSDLTQILPAVIYGTWGEAIQAAQVTARTSNFGFLANIMVRAGGSIIMHQVAKRIVAKRGGGDPHEQLSAELDRLDGWLGEGPFLCGDRISVADVAAHGALTCVSEFPAFAKMMANPRLAAWFERVDKQRRENQAAV